MSEHIPSLQLPPMMSEENQRAVSWVFSNIQKDPVTAAARLDLLVGGETDKLNNPEANGFVMIVEESIVATRNGRDLCFDETTEDAIFTPEARSLAQRVVSEGKITRTSNEHLEEAMAANTRHRWLELARYLVSLRTEDPTQNPPSVA